MKKLLTLLMLVVSTAFGSNVAYWKMDEKTGVTSSTATVGADSLDINSSPTAPNVVRGIVGPVGYYRAIQSTNTGTWTATDVLNGTATDSALSLDSTEGATIAFWINETPGALNGSTYAYAVSKGVGTSFPSSLHNYAVAFKTNQIAFSFGNGTQRVVANNTANWGALTSIWHHVAVTVNPTATLGLSDFKFYLDGALLSTNNNLLVTGTLGVGLSISTNTGPLVVMNSPDGSSTAGFLGGLDELRVYNSVLTSSDISILANVPSSTVTTNDLWLGTGSRVYDASGIRYYPNGQTTTYASNIIDWINQDTNTTIALNKLPASITNVVANSITNALSSTHLNATVTANVLTYSITNSSPLFQLGINNGGALTNLNITTASGTLPIAHGGTGATSAAGARTNLSLVVGTDVQAWSANLDMLAILNASSLTNININTGTVGTLADNRLSSNVPLKDGANTFTGVNIFTTNMLVRFAGPTANPYTFISNTVSKAHVEMTTSDNTDAYLTLARSNNAARASLGVNGIIGYLLLGDDGAGFGRNAVQLSGGVETVGFGVNTLNFNNSSAGAVTFNGATVSTPNGWALNADWLFPSSSAGVTTNSGGIFSLNAITASNFLAGAFGGFTGNGSALTNLNASQLLSGTIPDTRLSSNIPLKNSVNVFTSNNTFNAENLSFTNQNGSSARFFHEGGTGGMIFSVASSNNISFIQLSADTSGLVNPRTTLSMGNANGTDGWDALDQVNSTTLKVGVGFPTLFLGYAQGAGTINVGDETSDTVVLNASSGSWPNGFNGNSGQLILSASPTGPITNGVGGIVSQGTVTMSNLVLSAGSGSLNGIFSANIVTNINSGLGITITGAGLNNYTAAINPGIVLTNGMNISVGTVNGLNTAQIGTNITGNAPWLTASASGNIFSVNTNSTKLAISTFTDNNGTAITNISLTTGVSGTLPVTKGGTGTGTQFTQGSVVFADGSGVYSQDNGGLFYDSTLRRLGVNISSGLLGKIHIQSTNGTDSGIFLDGFSSTATQGASLVMRRAEGTQASPSAVLSGDLLASIGARGYGATGFTANNRAKIHAVASENWSDTAQGTRYEFYTTPSGGLLTAEAMRITDTGLVGFNTTTPLGQIHVSATNEGNVAYYDSYSTNTGATIIQRRARGTLASPTAVQSGDILGGITLRGYGTTGFSSNGRVRMNGVTTENWTDSAQGAYLAWFTTLTGGTNTTENMRLTESGQLLVGTNSGAAGNKAVINGTTEIFGGAAAMGPATGQNNFVLSGSTNGGLGYVQVVGGRAFTRVATLTNYTLGVGDYYLGVNSTNATITVTLPAATVFPNGGTFVVVQEFGTNSSIIITRAGADTINALTTNAVITTTLPTGSQGRAMRTVTSDGISSWSAY